MNRIMLRPVLRDDAEELIGANLASRDLHHPWSQPFTDQAGFAAYLAEMDGITAVGLVARERDSDALIGVLSLTQIFRKGFQNAYLGYYGMQSGVGRGLMTDAVSATLDYAFVELGLHRLEANVQPGNIRSIALLQRCGFRKEGFSPCYLRIDGVWRDHERWAILSDGLA